MLVLCTDTALGLRAELEAINPSQMMPISHLIQQFVLTASQSVFTEAFSRAGLQLAGAEPAGLAVTDAFLCKAEGHLSALQHGHPYSRSSTPG